MLPTTRPLVLHLVCRSNVHIHDVHVTNGDDCICVKACDAPVVHAAHTRYLHAAWTLIARCVDAKQTRYSTSVLRGAGMSCCIHVTPSFQSRVSLTAPGSIPRTGSSRTRPRQAKIRRRRITVMWRPRVHGVCGCRVDFCLRPVLDQS